MRQVLSQEEVNALLGGIGTGEVEAVSRTARPACDTAWWHALLRHLETLEVEITFELENTEIDVDTLMHLQVGDIILLDQDRDSDILVKVEGAPKFKGTLRTIRQNQALEITVRLALPAEEGEHA